ncbi:MAG TPA: AAA family ATPase, partial [Chloroflexota bacterium]
MAGQVDAALIRQVQDALTHLYAPAYLQTHALAERVVAVGARPGAAARGRQLRQLILESVRALRPGDGASADPRAWRAHRILELRYLETAEPPAIQRELGLAKSQYYVEHARAVEAVASLLAEHLGRSGDEERLDDTSAAPGRGPEAAREEASRRGGIPVSPTSFVGRDQELAAIASQLEGDEASGRPPARLVTLTGPAGTGKTRLASEAAAGVAARLGAAAYLVRLGSIRDPDLVLPAVADVLGIRERSTPALVARLKARLRSGRSLLVLDNLEQL